MQYTGITSYGAEDFAFCGLAIEPEDVPQGEEMKEDTYDLGHAGKVSANKERPDTGNVKKNCKSTQLSQLYSLSSYTFSF